MKKVIKVDVYGKCGTLALNRGYEPEAISQYKFYLSFENNKCPFYATEKIYRIIDQDLSSNPPVPVVLGPNKTWYEEHLPSNSFIHVDDFENPERLAKYLDYLDKHHEDYIQYLNWRRTYKKACDAELSVCKLCHKLVNSSLVTNKTPGIQDFESFWKRAKCQNVIENSDSESSTFVMLRWIYWSLGL